MTSTAYINLVTDGVISTLNANKAALGDFVTIYERDQEPSVLADHKDLLPVLVVMPLTNPDSVKMTMGGSEMYHNFSLSITGYYSFDNLTDDIRTMRGYAYDCLDLFRGTNSKVSHAHVYSGSVNPGYFVMVDTPIYKWIVRLNMKMLEV